jgi:hypothetical protein
MAAHARSKKAEAKKARRNKRRAGRDTTWVPENIMGELVATQAAIAADLEAFDARITERGWDFDDELSDDVLAIWYFAPSEAEVDDESVQGVTGVCLTAAEDAEVVHLMFVGSAESIQLTPDELFKHIDAIEAYRVGDPRPDLNHS